MINKGTLHTEEIITIDERNKTLCLKQEKAILVVSFGTSFPDTCKKTIDVIEQRIGEHFSDYKIYRAWTSK